MSIEEIFAKHNLYCETKKDEIKKINTCLTTKSNKTKKDVTEFLINHKDENISVEGLNEPFSRKQILEIYSNVAKVREIRASEITDDFLFILERHYYDKFKNIEFMEKTFNSLDINEKLRIALFCSGTEALYQQFDYMSNFLKNEFNLKTDFSKDENYIKLDGYNHELKTSVVKLFTTHNSDFEIENISSGIIKLFNHGYKGFIDIFERSLSENGNFAIIGLNDDFEIINPKIIRNYYRREEVIFQSNKKDVLEQWAECLTYVTKNIWYQRNKDDVSDDEYDYS